MYLKRRPAEKWGPPLSTLVCLEWLLIGHAYLNDLVSVWKSELSRTHCCFQSGDRYTWKCLKVGSYSFPCICNSFPPATSPAYMTSVTTKFPSLSKVYPQRQSGVMRVELALYCQHASTCSVEHRVHAHTHTHRRTLEIRVPELSLGSVGRCAISWQSWSAHWHTNTAEPHSLSLSLGVTKRVYVCMVSMCVSAGCCVLLVLV